MLQLQPKLKDWETKHNFALVLVTPDSIQEVRDFLAQTPLDATILLDPNGHVFQQYGVQAIPTNVLVDENGNMVRGFVGWGSNELEQVEKWVESGS